MAYKKINDAHLTDIADAIRNKAGGTDTYKPSEMAAAINELAVGGVELPEEAFVITGDCSYKFNGGGWDWYIDIFEDKITTQDISNATYMFNGSKVEGIPFDLNFKNTDMEMKGCFNSCTKLTTLPKINNLPKPKSLENIFSSCHNLKTVPEDIESWFNWSAIDGATSSYSSNRSGTFSSCFSLRKIPMSFLAHGNPVVTFSYSNYYTGFANCYSLDEIVDLPNPHLNATWTSNGFNAAFGGCMRVKNITFATPNGAPYKVNWKSQTIDLSSNVGWDTIGKCTKYNSGITNDKGIFADIYAEERYQALKNDPDWWTANPAYSRYNHDSAVATINSLPDTSAYLATAGGTNTIKFKGAAGSKTDGGAINTLTEEEIAVAAAKGWTVTFA